jgi:hypothetical protein
MTSSEPEVMLLVTLLRAVPFELLRKYGIFSSNDSELNASGVTRGKSRKGIIR